MSKFNGIIKILRKFNILIDGPEDILSNIERLPRLVSRETFSSWKNRVFNDKSLEICVCKWTTPAQTTRICNMQIGADKKYFKDLVKYIDNMNVAKKNSAVKDAVCTERNKARKMPKEALQNALDELRDNGSFEMERSVEECLVKMISTIGDEVTMEAIICRLIKLYNSAVKIARKE